MEEEQEREMMPVEQEKEPEINSKIIKGLIENCMKSLEIGEDTETAASKVLTLYVVFKVADVSENLIIDLVLTKLKKFLMNITPVDEIKEKNTTALYFSLFGECIG